MSRILYVVPVYPVFSMTFVVNEILALQQAGHEVTVVPVRPSASQVPLHEEHRRIHDRVRLPELVSSAVLRRATLALLRWPRRCLGASLQVLKGAAGNPYDFVRTLLVLPKAFAVAHLAAERGVEWIHAHFATAPATVAVIAGEVAGIPKGFTTYAYDIFSTRPRQRNDSLPQKLALADRVVSTHEFGRQYLLRRWKAQGHNLHVVYSGILPESFPYSGPPDDDGVLAILNVGRWTEKKGLDTLLRAAGLLEERGVPFRVKLIGGGPEEPRLRALIEELRLEQRVELHGPIPQARVRSEMVECDVFVLPCRVVAGDGDRDGIPTVLFEAMAIGRPVITCPESGIPELVEDGSTGLLVPPDDPERLAAAIERIAADRALALELGRNARRKAETQHDVHRNARALVAMYEDSVSERVAAGSRR